jgi:DNA-directed RNA polymerase subunit M/transcription elongation factor TFIIS
MKPATQEQHARTSCSHCPACNSTNISRFYDTMEYDDNRASIDIECYDCGASWKDVYTITGYSNLETAQLT